MRWVILSLAALALVGCKKSVETGGSRSSTNPEAIGGWGKQLMRGKMTGLRLTPDFKTATVLVDPEPPRLEGAPAQMRIGELWAVSLDTGAAKKLGEGVTNLPGGYLTSPDGRWAAVLQGYDAASETGRLTVSALSGKVPPVQLGERVGFIAISPDSKWIAFVDGTALKLAPLGGEARLVADGVSTTQFSPDSKWLIYRQTLSQGGGLFAMKLGAKAAATRLGERVGDYGISPDSKRVAFTVRSTKTRDTYDLFLAELGGGAGKLLTVGTSLFAFSKDGKWLARTEGVRPDQLGDLVVGGADGGTPHTIGEHAASFTFSPDSKSIAALVQYNPRGPWGSLAVAPVEGGAAQIVGEKVNAFDWGPKSQTVAFIARVIKPIVSEDLFVFRVGDKEAKRIAEYAFGYEFSPDGDSLLFRQHCISKGRACELDQLPLPAADKPKPLLDGVYSFKPSRDGSRVLLSFGRMDSDAYDTGMVNVKSGAHRTLDGYTVLPAWFAAEDGSRAVYVIDGPHQQGLYLATGLP